MKLSIDLPDEDLEAIAARAAEIVLERGAATATVPMWMTPKEAAEYARCPVQRIYDLRSSGVLGSYADGAAAKVLRSELDAHLGLALSPAEQRRRLRSA